MKCSREEKMSAEK